MKRIICLSSPDGVIKALANIFFREDFSSPGGGVLQSTVASHSNGSS